MKFKSREKIGTFKTALWRSSPFVLLAVLLFGSLPVVAQGSADVLTNTSDGTIAASLAYGTLTPGRTSTPSTQTVQFRLRDKKQNGGDIGYKLTASATFSVTTTGATLGGSTIAASDIGVGITSVVAASAVITPRTDTIASGFNYDPGTVTAVNGLTPYAGAASGTATLADLAAGPVILSGSNIGTDAKLTTANNYLTVTMKFGVLPQSWTPANFTATITLTLAKL